MSQNTVVDDHEKGRMSGSPWAPGDGAAGPGTADEGAPPGHASPTAGGQQPDDRQPDDRQPDEQRRSADVEPMGAVGAAEPPGVPALAEESGERQAEPAGGAGHAGTAESAGAADPSAGSVAGRMLLDRETLQRRWQEIQASFVDDPRQAVGEADSLVSDAIRELVDSLAAERSGIEHHWHGASDASTENFRVALLRYRDVVQFLLSVQVAVH